VVGFGGDFAVEAEESLLIWRERRNINFVLLVGVHLVLEIVIVLGFEMMVRICVRFLCDLSRFREVSLSLRGDLYVAWWLLF